MAPLVRRPAAARRHSGPACSPTAEPTSTAPPADVDQRGHQVREAGRGKRLAENGGQVRQLVRHSRRSFFFGAHGPPTAPRRWRRAARARPPLGARSRRRRRCSRTASRAHDASSRSTPAARSLSTGARFATTHAACAPCSHTTSSSRTHTARCYRTGRRIGWHAHAARARRSSRWIRAMSSPRSRCAPASASSSSLETSTSVPKPAVLTLTHAPASAGRHRACHGHGLAPERRAAGRQHAIVANALLGHAGSGRAARGCARGSG